MATDRNGNKVHQGASVTFREIGVTTRVVAAADAGIYIESAELGTRFVSDGDSCYEADDQD